MRSVFVVMGAAKVGSCEAGCTRWVPMGLGVSEGVDALGFECPQG